MKQDIEWHKTCKCKCRLDASVCNNKQKWNEDKCRCDCKELINKGMRDKGFIWNPSNCKCECDKSCEIEQFLNYKNCKCRKKKLINYLKCVVKILMEIKCFIMRLYNNNFAKCNSIE